MGLYLVKIKYGSAHLGTLKTSCYVPAENDCEARGIAQGGMEASSSHACMGLWFTTADPDRDYATGAETYYSIHAPRNTTLSSIRRIARVLGCNLR
jgi:hypothetical protein